ncbi:MAG: zinc-binding dehydrogenase [Deltaproteobacteria bacterium]|nr:zinc-binding dehydrogenase [Deltaproteobacteria bacterium]
MKRRSLLFTAPRQLVLAEESLAPPGPGQVLVATLVSAISPGTELLIYRGQFPRGLRVDASIAALSGDFAYPLKYGYAAVGRVEALGPGVPRPWQGRLVFSFHPHESHFVADVAELFPVPPEITPEEAAFLPTLETAATLVLDGSPLLGEQVAVFGQGVVGLLTTALLALFPLSSLVTLDHHPRRRLASENLGAHASLDPADPHSLARLPGLLQGDRPHAGADLTFELTGNPAALDLAVAATGYHGRVVVGSWYGDKTAPLNLGGRFHRGRLRLLSSQVSTIAPELRGRFVKARILAWVWEMLPEISPARLITHRFPLREADRAYALLDREPQEAIQVLLTY